MRQKQRIISIGILFTISVSLLSCHGQKNKISENSCREIYERAYNLVYNSPVPATDSALILLNECMDCDTMRKAAIELKINILIGEEKYLEGIKFVDSLKGSDFNFHYKRIWYLKVLQALKYNSEGDSTRRDSTYNRLSEDLENYINHNDLSTEEFQDIYITLYALKEKIEDANKVNQEVDSLEQKYPGQKRFFEFLRVYPPGGKIEYK
jgi:hypothetical protein